MNSSWWTAQELQKIAARRSFGPHTAMRDPANLSLSVTLSVIQRMESGVKKLDHAIAKLLNSIPNTLESVKSIGPGYARRDHRRGRGDIGCFKNHNGLAKYAGLV